MNLLSAAIEMVKLSAYLLAMAHEDSNACPPEDKDYTLDCIWKDISRIAAEQAAKPEIQGNAEHSE